MTVGTKWYVYLLYSSKTRRTYVGATTDPTRRLRQHNGEIVGGARSTRKGAGTWSLVCYLGDFKDRSTCYRWEKLVKSRASGFRDRFLAMQLVSAGSCPVSKRYPKRPMYIPPNMLTLTVMGVLPDE
jgi:predicted GIY-YIG superfamily endonuclease